MAASFCHSLLWPLYHRLTPFSINLTVLFQSSEFVTSVNCFPHNSREMANYAIIFSAEGEELKQLLKYFKTRLSQAECEVHEIEGKEGVL